MRWRATAAAWGMEPNPADEGGEYSGLPILDSYSSDMSHSIRSVYSELRLGDDDDPVSVEPPERLTDAACRPWTEDLRDILRSEGSEKRRVKRLYALVQDFRSTSSAIGRAIIVDRTRPPSARRFAPVHGRGVAGGEKYLVTRPGAPGGIFFKFARDSHGVYGGDDSAGKAAKHELHAFQTIASMIATGTMELWGDFEFPLLSTVDFLGQRLLAVSLLPISSSSLVYGSQDAGRHVHAIDAAVNSAVRSVCESLNLAAHNVTVGAPSWAPELRRQLLPSLLKAAGGIDKAGFIQLCGLATEALEPSTSVSADSSASPAAAARPAAPVMDCHVYDDPVTSRTIWGPVDLEGHLVETEGSAARRFLIDVARLCPPQPAGVQSSDGGRVLFIPADARRPCVEFPVLHDEHHTTWLPQVKKTLLNGHVGQSEGPRRYFVPMRDETVELQRWILPWGVLVGCRQPSSCPSLEAAGVRPVGTEPAVEDVMYLVAAHEGRRARVSDPSPCGAFDGSDDLDAADQRLEAAARGLETPDGLLEGVETRLLDTVVQAHGQRLPCIHLSLPQHALIPSGNERAASGSHYAPGGAAAAELVPNARGSRIAGQMVVGDVCLAVGIGWYLRALLRPELVRQSPLPLSSDSLSGFGKCDLCADAGELNPCGHDRQRHELRLSSVAKWLVHTEIPRLANDLDAGHATATTGAQLVKVVHSRGINLRMLGLLRSSVKSSWIRALILVEMSARTLRRLLDSRLRQAASLEEEAEHTESPSWAKRTLDGFVRLAFSQSPESDRFWVTTVWNALVTKFSIPVSEPDDPKAWSQPLDPRALPGMRLVPILTRFLEVAGVSVDPAEMIAILDDETVLDETATIASAQLVPRTGSLFSSADVLSALESSIDDLESRRDAVLEILGEQSDEFALMSIKLAQQFMRQGRLADARRILDRSLEALSVQSGLTRAVAKSVMGDIMMAMEGASSDTPLRTFMDAQRLTAQFAPAHPLVARLSCSIARYGIEAGTPHGRTLAFHHLTQSFQTYDAVYARSNALDLVVPSIVAGKSEDLATGIAQLLAVSLDREAADSRAEALPRGETLLEHEPTGLSAEEIFADREVLRQFSNGWLAPTNTPIQGRNKLRDLSVRREPTPAAPRSDSTVVSVARRLESSLSMLEDMLGYPRGHFMREVSHPPSLLGRTSTTSSAGDGRELLQGVASGPEEQYSPEQSVQWGVQGSGTVLCRAGRVCTVQISCLKQPEGTPLGLDGVNVGAVLEGPSRYIGCTTFPSPRRLARDVHFLPIQAGAYMLILTVNDAPVAMSAVPVRVVADGVDCVASRVIAPRKAEYSTIGELPVWMQLRDISGNVVSSPLVGGRISALQGARSIPIEAKFAPLTGSLSRSDDVAFQSAIREAGIAWSGCFSVPDRPCAEVAPDDGCSNDAMTVCGLPIAELRSRIPGVRMMEDKDLVVVGELGLDAGGERPTAGVFKAAIPANWVGNVSIEGFVHGLWFGLRPSIEFHAAPGALPRCGQHTSAGLHVMTANLCLTCSRMHSRQCIYCNMRVMGALKPGVLCPRCSMLIPRRCARCNGAIHSIAPSSTACMCSSCAIKHLDRCVALVPS
jgi:hypothetical protein